MTYPVGPVSGRLQTDGTLRGRLSSQGGLSGGLSIGTTSAFPAYDGPYEVTPAQDTQTVLIEGLRATQDITINPIPSNYGRITWDGSVMTIS